MEERTEVSWATKKLVASDETIISVYEEGNREPRDDEDSSGEKFTVSNYLVTLEKQHRNKTWLTHAANTIHSRYQHSYESDQLDLPFSISISSNSG